MENNPWGVENLDVYLYYCCPQCEHRSKTKHLFIDHAQNSHPESKETLIDNPITVFKTIKDEPAQPVEIDIKTEPTIEELSQANDPFDNVEENFDIQDGYDHNEDYFDIDENVEAVLEEYDQEEMEESEDKLGSPEKKKPKVKLKKKRGRPAKNALDGMSF